MMKAGLVSVLATLVLSTGALAATPGGGFHRPASAAERALAATLKRADADEVELDNLFQRYGPVPSRQRVDYRQMLTSRLIRAMSEVERDLVRRDCAGRYRDGEVCGLDYSPITCAQDYPKRYEVMTLESGPRVATISAAWPGAAEVATYRLVRDAYGWKIDAVACANGARFNYPRSD